MKSILAAVIAAVLVMGMVRTQGQQLQKVTLNYPTRSGASWPLFIAKEGGYYQKYGLDATLVFAGHPAGIAMVVSDQAQMSSYNLESVMQASSRGDAPFAVATLEAVDVAGEPVPVQLGVVGRLAPVVRQHVGLGGREVSAHRRQVVADHVHGAVELAEVLVRPGQEVLDGAAEAVVVVERTGVVAGLDQIEVEPVDAPAVPQGDLLDLPEVAFVVSHGSVIPSLLQCTSR